MADNPDTVPKEGAAIPVSDIPHAPFIFYDWAPCLGFTNGVVNITLAANCTWIRPNGVANEQVVVAYLRGSIQAARNLRKAIDEAQDYRSGAAGADKARAARTRQRLNSTWAPSIRNGAILARFESHEAVAN